VSAAIVQQAVEAAFRQEWGRVVATLIRRTGDWDLAEECARDAFAEAPRRWSADGRTTVWLPHFDGGRADSSIRLVGQRLSMPSGQRA
jgi:RNA polymerase sigma-70 factor, ECF subfamily